QLHPERFRFVEIARLIFAIVRSVDGHRFTRREHMTTHVALRTQTLPRSQSSIERLLPIPDRPALHPYTYTPHNRRSASLVREANSCGTKPILLPAVFVSIIPPTQVRTAGKSPLPVALLKGGTSGPFVLYCRTAT